MGSEWLDNAPARLLLVRADVPLQVRPFVRAANERRSRARRAVRDRHTQVANVILSPTQDRIVYAGVPMVDVRMTVDRRG